MPLKPAALLLQLLTTPGLRWVGLKIDQNRKLAIHIPIPNLTNKYQKVVKRISKHLRQGCGQRSITMEPTHSSFRGATNLDIAGLLGYATYLAGLMHPMDGFV